MVKLHRHQGHADRSARTAPRNWPALKHGGGATHSAGARPTPPMALTTRLGALTLFRNSDLDSALRGAEAPHNWDPCPPWAPYRIYNGPPEAAHRCGSGADVFRPPGQVRVRLLENVAVRYGPSPTCAPGGGQAPPAPSKQHSMSPASVPVCPTPGSHGFAQTFERNCREDRPIGTWERIKLFEFFLS